MIVCRTFGVADSIINLSFGLIVGAVAAAIAFGWGVRDLAKLQIEGFGASTTNRLPSQKPKLPFSLGVKLSW